MRDQHHQNLPKVASIILHDPSLGQGPDQNLGKRNKSPKVKTGNADEVAAEAKRNEDGI